jgi:hypothetical protein
MFNYLDVFEGSLFRHKLQTILLFPTTQKKCSVNESLNLLYNKALFICLIC